MSDYQSKFTGAEIDAILEDAKNKPFGDNLPVTERFSQAETPNPVSFGSEILGLTGYKIFDTALTQNQLMTGATVTTTIDSYNINVTEALTDGTITPFGEIATIVQLPSGTGYLIAYQSSELLGTTIPEVGTYFVMHTGSPLPDDLVVEISYIGTKKIDPKYLPNGYGNSGGIKIFEFKLSDSNFGEDGLYHLSDSENFELEKLVMSEEPLILKAFINSEGDDGVQMRVAMTLQHSCIGYFYTFMSGLRCDATYSKLDKTIDFKINFASSTSSTYSLRGGEPTFAEFLEMIKESARERGLI